MAISNVSNSAYNAFIYQWRNQGLQNTGTTTSGGTSLNNYSYNGKSTVSSMVELARYAMDAMGVDKNSRVTFSQIQQYKSQLEEEFSASIKKGLAGLGVAKDAAFSVTVGEDGKVQVDSGHADKAKIQAWFDANPEYGKNIRKDLEEKGVDKSTPVKFNVSASGVLSVVSTEQNKIQDYFNKNAAFSDDLLKGLKEMEVDVSKPFTLAVDEFGLLSVKGDHPDKDKIEQYIKEHPEVAADYKAIADKLGLEEGAKAELTVGADGKITAKLLDQSEGNKAISDYLNSKNYGSVFKKGLESTGVDPDVDFRLTVDSNGKIKVAGEGKDIEKIQKFFDDNPELSKKYLQVQALADLDSARKAMNVNPNEMRKRIELESMAIWWGDSGNATSGIGAFSGGNLSLLSGLNTTV